MLPVHDKTLNFYRWRGPLHSYEKLKVERMSNRKIADKWL